MKTQKVQSMMNSADHVITFWFGKKDSEIFGQFRAAWFQKDDAFDEKIRTNFHHSTNRPSQETGWMAS